MSQPDTSGRVGREPAPAAVRGADKVDAFITRWANSGASERANCAPFLSELCDLLEVPRPDPAREDDRQNTYVFERAVTFHHADGTTSPGRIDLYRRGAFVLEAKQGSSSSTPSSHDVALFAGVTTRPGGGNRRGTAQRGTQGWDRAMLGAKAQAERYVRALPASEGRPPFILVVDVGYCIEVYSEFSMTGGMYVPYPDPSRYRIALDDLRDPTVRARLHAVWVDPLSLDLSRKSAAVTREIADKLAQLARSLESAHGPEQVSSFLMRVIFTLFAEDMRLLPAGRFTEYLKGISGRADHFRAFIEPVWQTMAKGGYSTLLKSEILHFNGGLFEDATALPITEAQLELLIGAATQDWREVEPAIFGTLLERALDERERHRLGAHFTPRAYVERLVNQTVIAPLRERWRVVQFEAGADTRAGQTAEAVRRIEAFHEELCRIRVLDPACGTGNFLYVALELMKRLEGEVLDTLAQLGRDGPLEQTVDPRQFLGIEVNTRAAKIAELVLWIGYLQWHARTNGGVDPPIPVLRALGNIECRDAILEYERTRPARDQNGQSITRWDGVSTRTHPVTGLNVPDETRRVTELEYVRAKRAAWPAADFVVGNPPFIGAGAMRAALGDGYAKAVRAAWHTVPESSDFVMYWWEHAATLVREGKLVAFGFVTTNSLRQTFNRRVLETHLNAKNPVSLVYAIADHPWVDAADGAAVRIAMTVARAGRQEGVLHRVFSETETSNGEYDVTLETWSGRIRADLTVGANVAGARPLTANVGLSAPGVKLHGAGFIVAPERARELGLGRIRGLERHIREYRNGRDLTARSRGAMVIDLFGLTANEVRSRFPEVYQHVAQTVKPERDANNRVTYRENWWVFGEPRANLRPALEGLKRYIATVETAKHRVFQFLDASILPDNMIVAIALDDAYFLGILSSRVHVAWALAAGGTLEDRPRYNKSVCFEKFPFPTVSPQQENTIRGVAEEIDAHRKRQLGSHPELTLTELYNTLENLRSGAALTDKDRRVNELGLVNTLLELHVRLDAAVLNAYGLENTATDANVLERLVALNTHRSLEEWRGEIKYLRPAYQDPLGAATQPPLSFEDGAGDTSGALEQAPFPKDLREQHRVITSRLRIATGPVTAGQLAKSFTGVPKNKLDNILGLLVELGQVHELGGGRYAL